MHGARSGFDGIAITEHGQSSYDMVPNPDLVASALAYQTEAEGLDVAIFPMGRSLGKAREPRPRRRGVRDDRRALAAAGSSPASPSACTTTPASTTGSRRSRSARASTRTSSCCCARGVSTSRSRTTAGSASTRRSTSGPGRCSPHLPVWITGIGNPRTMQMCLERNFGFNYLSWFGAKLTGKRIFDRFWEIADQVGVPRNPYRLGFLQTIAVAETDERAEQEYARAPRVRVPQGPGLDPSGEARPARRHRHPRRPGPGQGPRRLRPLLPDEDRVVPRPRRRRRRHLRQPRHRARAAARVLRRSTASAPCTRCSASARCRATWR